MFSTFSHSLGDHSVHELPAKLLAAASAGLEAVEISTIDLDHHALKIEHLSAPDPLLSAAIQIGSLCKELNLVVTCLQPVKDVVEVESGSVESARQRLTALFPVMDALGTDLLLVCSSSLPPSELHCSLVRAAENLRAIGIEAGRHQGRPKRIAFEALCWGTYISTWSQAWQVVQAADLPNVGICLDSFNTLAREWADPTLEGGIQPGADVYLAESLAKLSRLPGQKIFLLQLADGRQLTTPLVPDGEQPARMRWSRAHRLFPMDSIPGYLPVTAFVAAVCATGYDGFWSAEVFNTSLADRHPNVPAQHATRALEGLKRLELFISSESRVSPLSLVEHDPLLRTLPRLELA
ncbi:hypothetical protein CROQUDRAFT_69540 [Cronartium quercuum f. sp. fusiforme G11]|uniref:Xylose isomerase-like TIM barrel domain-containing protein n=1 Tax=Cronartium quercuum f. sp. fusiforme G11 TaxID=708437 RepID=A0A9P6NAK3_9BASI|nr:hypothetical protein CROQUDRAFT_69540 [Cronartium quercuum f. sp. fusiforme G11]